jgi:hypothetical protein
MERVFSANETHQQKLIIGYYKRCRKENLTISTHKRIRVCRALRWLLANSKQSPSTHRSIASILCDILHARTEHTANIELLLRSEIASAVEPSPPTFLPWSIPDTPHLPVTPTVAANANGLSTIRCVIASAVRDSSSSSLRLTIFTYLSVLCRTPAPVRCRLDPLHLTSDLRAALITAGMGFSGIEEESRTPDLVMFLQAIAKRQIPGVAQPHMDLLHALAVISCVIASVDATFSDIHREDRPLKIGTPLTHGLAHATPCGFWLAISGEHLTLGGPVGSLTELREISGGYICVPLDNIEKVKALLSIYITMFQIKFRRVVFI